MRPCSDVALHTIEIALNELLHLPMMRICKSGKDDMPKFFVVIAEIQTFLKPVFEAIVNEDEWQNTWEIGVRKWSNLKSGIDRDKSS